MSLVMLSHACSHLQNASRARLGITSIPSSNLLLSLSLALQSSGFISSVTRGGPSPPPAAGFSGYSPEPITQENVASRRLWLGMKYWNNEPVLSKLRMISKPTKRIWLNVEELAMVARGKDCGEVRGVRGIGECLFVSTDRGILEIRECVERRIGGQPLCRVM